MDGVSKKLIKTKSAKSKCQAQRATRNIALQAYAVTGTIKNHIKRIDWKDWVNHCILQYFKNLKKISWLDVYLQNAAGSLKIDDFSL